MARAHRGLNSVGTASSTETPSPGALAPAFSLPDQNGKEVTLSAALSSGQRVFVYFYPKALTSGCTTQAVSLRDAGDQLDGVTVIGISPDSSERLRDFDRKHDLGFSLLSDADHTVAERYGVWKLKKLYGREYMGVQRSGFLIDDDGTVAAAWPKISPKDTLPKLLAALADEGGGDDS